MFKLTRPCIALRAATLAALSTCALLLATANASPAATPCTETPLAQRADTLRPFKSEDELQALLKCLREEAQKRVAAQRRASPGAMADNAAFASMAAPAPSAPAAAAPAAAAKVASAEGAAESVTNVQTAGVDEGGIVKVHGKHLVILRRGRLFTVSVNAGDLKPVATLDAFAPEADPRGAWYDEMLLSGNTIVVIGYSYARGGTEVGLFEIDAEGRLSYRATYHLRSNDYYSSRNYASRLVGNKLIFYTPLNLNLHREDYGFPAYRRWHRGATPAEFKRIAPATRIYRADDGSDYEYGLTLHTVSVCDLSTSEARVVAGPAHVGASQAPDRIPSANRNHVAPRDAGREEGSMRCEATAVLGPHGRVFYVSAHSVYVWATNPRSGSSTRANTAAVFRIPLDGGAPSGIKTRGSPIDQFSFLESQDGHLNVLLRSQGRGDAMWEAESAAGDTALLRLPLARMGDGRDAAPREAYRRLPHPAGHTLQNRYIGQHLLYGAGSTWGRPKGERQNLYALRWDQPDGAVLALPLDHSVDRIEALGQHAVAVGTREQDLLFTSITLGNEPGLAHVYKRANAAQGETRSHGFFYRPESDTEGLLGLPIARAGRAGHRQLQEGSAGVLFLKNKKLKLEELGSLDATSGSPPADHCRASCVDWYGNARPLFLKNRVFALLGYELVEGRVSAERIEELRRVSFAPGGGRVAR